MQTTLNIYVSFKGVLRVYTGDNINITMLSFLQILLKLSSPEISGEI